MRQLTSCPAGCMAIQISMAAAKSTIACMMLLLQSHISLAAGLAPIIACIDHSLFQFLI